MDTIRVSDCLRLAEEKKLDLLPLTPQIDMGIFDSYPSVKFPLCVYKGGSNMFSGFGVLVDYLIQYFLINDHPQFVVRDRCSPEFIHLCSMSIKEALPILLVMSTLPVSVDINWSLINKIRRDLKTSFSPFFVKGYFVVLCYEVNVGKVSGRPDLLLVRDVVINDKVVKEVNVIDIKTVSKPKTNASSHYKQISAYASLLTSRGATIVSIGIYYPLQNKPYLRVMVPRDWDHQLLLEHLHP